ncbi:MAG: hypothetical protein A2W90_00730 [Bacteroidetes bacterium GWF2_42_66]|nr:MAG: hypothetical protein A2W92_02290 [Bacteroidetes bacterium GWA2_42_15]OFX99381.1 MAG: hypothetical protein A2W89_12130 [Bacteroidetes bacterium GWE2_42_39]OFY40433.1 MAG: hypothetical protein A2W90_00730 [Bacteroidetes bacterium GWF2_42_66]HBL76947.1 hypothetical protein [Prolixibacteraceae bacterium]HCR90816.1 hypothetical protein [Prolixibacteraceae bacterium]
MRTYYRNIVTAFLLFTGFSSTAEDQNQCLKCHGNHIYSIHNEWTERTEKRLMNPYFVIDSVRMSAGVHQSFSCTDCHSTDYGTYPHNGELKLEPMAGCLDCHGGDEKYASYQFEKIEEEFGKSVHAQACGDAFTCSKCHDQHYYQVTARNSESVTGIVRYSNEMCLSCHDNMQKYQLLSEGQKPELVEAHSWLPNKNLHFEHVRCIECHTEVVDSLMISHNIMPKENAVKRCVECHTADSRLKASLYKYQNLQSRSENGMMGNILSNESYVIGAYRNPLLNWGSILIFCVVLLGVSVHIIFRIIKK